MVKTRKSKTLIFIGGHGTDGGSSTELTLEKNEKMRNIGTI